MKPTSTSQALFIAKFGFGETRLLRHWVACVSCLNVEPRSQILCAVIRMRNSRVKDKVKPKVQGYEPEA